MKLTCYRLTSNKSYQVFLIILALIKAGLSPAVGAEMSLNCGTAKVVGGHACQTLKVVFDLSSCGKNITGKKAKMTCAGKEGIASIEHDGSTYLVNVKSIAEGEWGLDGSPYQISSYSTASSSP